MRTLIVYASRYGSTMEIGRWIAERLPWSEVDHFNVEKAPGPNEYELVFMGGGVYNEQVDKDIVHYAKTHQAAFKGKTTVIFAACLDTGGIYMKGRFIGGWTYLKPLMKVLKDQPPLYADTLSGEINPLKLSDKDYFYTRILNRDIDQVPYRSV